MSKTPNPQPGGLSQDDLSRHSMNAPQCDEFHAPREGLNGFFLLKEPTALVDSALQVYARCLEYPNSRNLHEAAHAYRRELIRIVTEYREMIR